MEPFLTGHDEILVCLRCWLALRATRSDPHPVPDEELND